MALWVTSDAIATIRAEATAAHPDECCGLLLGQGECIERAVPARNVAADPSTRFEIDPVALIAAHRVAREGGLQVLGYFHSHPAGHPVPSATDCDHAGGDGRVWAIIARDQLRFWRDGADGFAECGWHEASALPTLRGDG